MRKLIFSCLLILPLQATAESVESFYRFNCMSEVSLLEFSEVEIDANLLYEYESKNGSNPEPFLEAKYGLYKDNGSSRVHACKFASGEEWKIAHGKSYQFTLSMNDKEIIAFHTTLVRHERGGVRRISIYQNHISEICGEIGAQKCISPSLSGLKSFPISFSDLLSKAEDSAQ